MIIDNIKNYYDKITFGKTYLPIWCAILSMLCAIGCSDEFLDGPFSTTEEDGNVVIYIPSVKGVAAATRTDLTDPVNADMVAEGQVKSLMMYAYPEDGGDVKPFILGEPATVTQEYSRYVVTLDPGKYRIYIVGNLDPYLDKKLTNNISEDELKERVLKYSAAKYPNLNDGLPMASFPEDILEHEGGLVNVPAVKGASITADMKFLCSKVRLTLFFNSENADSYSRPGFDNERPLFTDFRLQNVADATFLDESKDPEHNFFSLKGNFVRMEYPEQLVTEDDIKGYDDLHKMNESQSSESSNKMAWRTTLYLPENLMTESDKGTTMYLNAQIEGSGRKLSYKVHIPKLSDDDEGEKFEPLRRAKFHDLTACVKSKGGFEVNAVVEDWTVNTLVHELHGPYFLKVEKTEHVPVTAGEETHLWYSSDVPVHFEPQKAIINGEERNVLIVEKMKGHNDSIVITANPILPLNYDLSESYFYIHAGNIKKKIQIWPFTIKPFFKVTPQYSAVEVREMIESGSNTLNLPIHFTTNLNRVRARLLDGWDEEDMPVKFQLSSECTSQSDSGIIYDGEKAKDGYNMVAMEGFVKGNSYWSERHVMTVEYTAYTEDGEQFGDPQIVEIEVLPKRYTYRIYFRPEADDWVAPHVYICEILALPYTLDKNLVKDQYKDRAARPVGGHLYTEKDPIVQKNWEGALRYSYTGKLSFRGWSTQGGPACNDPYEAVRFNPITESQGFYVFGTEDIMDNKTLKTGYGVKYIPPISRSDFGKNGGSEASIRERYDIDTDLMAAHRAQLSELCPLCMSQTKYNMKFPGICMLKSKKYPGWWYADLTEVANPGKTLVMFCDGHGNTSASFQVPGAYEPGLPLFDYADNEGWVLYKSGIKPNFVDDKPSTTGVYSEDTYRIYWQADNDNDLAVSLKNTTDGLQSSIITSNNAVPYHNFDASFRYIEFKLSSKLRGRGVRAHLILPVSGQVTQDFSLNDFVNINGVWCYTVSDDFNKSHGGLPSGNETDMTRFRIYWPHRYVMFGFNLWLSSPNHINYSFNNFDNSSQSFITTMNYRSGSRVINNAQYDYYEFHLPDDHAMTGGWHIHNDVGTYREEILLNYQSFTSSLGDGCMSTGRWVNYREDKEYRIYIPAKYNNQDVYAWVYGFPDDPAGNEKWVGPTTVNNVIGLPIITINDTEYYYIQFSDPTFFMIERPGQNAGVIARSYPGWGGGTAFGVTVNYGRTSFNYNPTRDVNELFINNTFTGLKQ